MKFLNKASVNAMAMTITLVGLVSCAVPEPSSQNTSPAPEVSTEATTSVSPKAKLPLNALDESSPSPSASATPEKVKKTEDIAKENPQAALPVNSSPANEVVQNTQSSAPAPPALTPVPTPPAQPAVQAPAAPAPPAPLPPTAPAPAPVVDAYVQQIYGYLANWCPSANVIIDHPSVTSGDVYGMTWWGGNTLALRSGMPNVMVKTFSLHECAHMMQARVFSNKSIAVQRMTEIYGGSGTFGLEQNADCIAAYLTPQTAPTTLGAGPQGDKWATRCSGPKGDAAIKIIQGQRP